LHHSSWGASVGVKENRINLENINDFPLIGQILINRGVDIDY
jgi:hypothetical protein